MRKAEALIRLRTTTEQIRKVTVMMQEEAYSIDILQKILVMQQAMDKFKRELRHAHLEACVSQALRERDDEKRGRATRELLKLLKT